MKRRTAKLAGSLILVISFVAPAFGLPCKLAKSDYTSLASSNSKLTRTSVEKLSADDGQLLCDTRRRINVVRRKNGNIDLKDIVDYDPQYLTKDEQDAIDKADARAMAAGLQPTIDRCRKDPNICPLPRH